MSKHPKRANAAIAQRLRILLALGISTASFVGCRLCADCDLESYGAYGGAWQRTLRDQGRVGSIYDPGGSRASDLSARADSEEADAAMRSLSDEESLQENGQSKRPGTDPDAETNPGRDSDDESLREMEQRLRGMDLQDIDHRSPEQAGNDWR